jgi:prepilin-type N-terminal cleavage/methylation domain-containing protein|tara:strand:+ start:97 stop:570 length:474 start_codon:yes stop_codon:yes gene_type:complete
MSNHYKRLIWWYDEFMKKGFSIMELLVVVAIIGVLAAVGVLAYNGYIANAKKKQATTGLMSIFLAQTEYKRNFGKFYQSHANCGFLNDDSAVINSNLFNGEGVITNNNYNFCIEYLSGSKTYQANAYLNDGSYDHYFTITNTNYKRIFDGQSWKEGW